MIRLVELSIPVKNTDIQDQNIIDELIISLKNIYSQVTRVNKEIVIMSNSIMNRSIFISNSKITISQNFNNDTDSEINQKLLDMNSVIKIIDRLYKCIKGKCELRQIHMSNEDDGNTQFNDIIRDDVLERLNNSFDSMEIYSFSSRIKINDNNAILNISKYPKGGYLNSLISYSEFNKDLVDNWIYRQVDLYRKYIKDKIIKLLY